MPKLGKLLEKGKRAKTFYEHGMDGLSLALSIADTEEGKALRKVDKHRQTQEPTSRSGRQHRRNDKKSRLAKAMIAQQRARSKKEKGRSRKERSKWDEARASTARVAIPGPSGTTPRKKVTFA
ncbi:hypothetical protein M404DRAFT_752071 [Pisolithus tinctorius Marx 270]|uniref:Uncharacterized protein n=1 Tax=Pisolithus tinctorius Marx 270 TaxID=870435 RepID=A0A0C3NIF4_PISTI|nr:hypothetical protein M404DRAFT_752071 [Pisolithus tinctorius Marx 270]